MMYKIHELSAEHKTKPEQIIETLDRAYTRIDALNPKLNAIVHDFREQASARAKVLVNEDPSNLPLYGVPVTIKESFVYRNSPCTINFPPLKSYAPDINSVLAQRLENAGAIILGKTNVPMLLSDCQTFGPLYPTANNPYDLRRTPGGSTGGGAAALAAQLSYAEIGSDIGGSIRNPANLCGLFGLKPTTNGHIHDGHVPPLPNRGTGFTALNSTGPLARSASDIEQIYKVCYQPLPEYQQYLDIQTSTPIHNKLANYKIAYYDELAGVQCSAPTQRGLQRVVKCLEDQGAQVSKIRIDEQLADKTLKTWVKLFGFVCSQDFAWPVRKILQFKFGKDLKKSSFDAKQELKKGLSMNFREYSKALREQKECIAEFSRYFNDYDFILSPTSIGPAFEHNHKHNNIEFDGQSYNYTDYCFGFVMFYNLLGNPVMSLPSGIDEKYGLPIGVSIAASHHSENQLIHFSKLLEKQGFEFQAPTIS
ncbi:MAG: amidase family protein [Oleiphilaceae bacterium]|nr:amidase family protein [Oleiphilaceae bacterium]